MRASFIYSEVPRGGLEGQSPSSVATPKGGAIPQITQPKGDPRWAF